MRVRYIGKHRQAGLVVDMGTRQAEIAIARGTVEPEDPRREFLGAVEPVPPEPAAGVEHAEARAGAAGLERTDSLQASASTARSSYAVASDALIGPEDAPPAPAGGRKRRGK